MQPAIAYVQLNVCQLEAAEVFYDRLLPLLGYDLGEKTRGEAVEALEEPLARNKRLPNRGKKPKELEEKKDIWVEYRHPLLTLRLREDVTLPVAEKRIGSPLSLAFHTQLPTEVDGLYHTVRRIGAEIVYPPRTHMEQEAEMRSFVFRDPDGTLFEILHVGA